MLDAKSKNVRIIPSTYRGRPGFLSRGFGGKDLCHSHRGTLRSVCPFGLSTLSDDVGQSIRRRGRPAGSLRARHASRRIVSSREFTDDLALSNIHQSLPQPDSIGQTSHGGYQETDPGCIEFAFGLFKQHRRSSHDSRNAACFRSRHPGAGGLLFHRRNEPGRSCQHFESERSDDSQTLENFRAKSKAATEIER